MANRLYLISSVFFLTAAVIAFRASNSSINTFNLLGSAFFAAAASAGLMRK
jgi:hypothetical protein